MRMLPTQHPDGSQWGYFDTTTGILYEVDGNDAFFIIAVLQVCDGDGCRIRNRLSRAFTTKADALTELDRIAALIEGKAPAQGWVEGAPPKDGKWYAVIDGDGDPVIVRYSPEPHAHLPWQTATSFRYSYSGPIHHLPTPIVLP